MCLVFTYNIEHVTLWFLNYYAHRRNVCNEFSDYVELLGGLELLSNCPQRSDPFKTHNTVEGYKRISEIVRCPKGFTSERDTLISFLTHNEATLFVRYKQFSRNDPQYITRP